MNMGALFILLTILGWLACTQDCKACDVKIEIYPERTVALLGELVNITCDVVVDVKEIMLLSISKDENDPIVVMRQGSGNVSYATKNAMQYKAEGRIDGNANRQYVTLTLLQPTTEDSGNYTCTVMYFDESSTFKQDNASSNLTVDSDLDKGTMEVVLAHLLTKVSSLENENQKLWTGIHQLLDKDSVILEKIRTLHDRNVVQIDELKQQDSNLRDSVSELDNKTQEQSHRILDLSYKVTYASAFSAALQSDYHISIDQIVVFPEILMSQGVGYDRRTGVYTATRRGLYAFQFGFAIGTTRVLNKNRFEKMSAYFTAKNVTLETENKILWQGIRQLLNKDAVGAYFSIQKNGVELASTRASDKGIWEHGSCSTVVALRPRDRVMVVVKDVTGNRPYIVDFHRFTIFSGYLIQPI